MTKYDRGKDKFISTMDGSFNMKDSSSKWNRRAESFDTPQGYLVFARRMELCLRAALDVSTEGREGLGSVTKDFLSVTRRFDSVKEMIRTDMSSQIAHASLADCGAGTGSFLSFIEWTGLPYPEHLTLLEPNDDFFSFLQKRIEGEVNTPTRDRLKILSNEGHSRHDEIAHRVYTVQDAQTGTQSLIQLIHAQAQEKSLPLVAKANGIIFVGVSKYFRPEEFIELVTVAQNNFQYQDEGNTAFNTQGQSDTLPIGTSRLERAAYRGIKAVHQTVISGRPTLHNFYLKEDILKFPGTPSIIHNYADAIVVRLRR